MKRDDPRACELLELAETMHYDIQSALNAVGRAGAVLDDLSPAELVTVAEQFSAEQARRDQGAVESFRQLRANTQEDHLKELFGF